MHTPNLEIAGNNLQIGVNTAQMRHLEFGFDVLDDEVDGDFIDAPTPRNNDVGVATGGGHEVVKRRLYETCVLLDDACDVTPSLKVDKWVGGGQGEGGRVCVCACG